jgi:hypothetical protein
MDAETISETLDYNSIRMQMLAREDVSALHSFIARVQ